MSNLITIAPLPRWKTYFKLLKNSSKPDYKVLSSLWVNKSEMGHWFNRSGWSLLAIVKHRMKIKKRKNIVIWIPDYFCYETISYLKDKNISIIYYPININGTPNFEVCNKMLTESIPDILLHVHYFGQDIDIEDSYNLAKKCDAWLVEDAAHVLIPHKSKGMKGDFIFYSPYKLLPIPNGSILVITSKGPSELNLEKFSEINKSLSNKKVSFKQQNKFQVFYWLIKRSVQMMGFNFHNQKSDFYMDYKNQLNKIPEKNMSTISKKLLFFQMDELNHEIYKRKKNSTDWYNLCQNIPIFKQMKWTFEKIDIPYLAIVTFDSYADASKIFNYFNLNNIPVTTWPDLPPTVLENPKKHQAAISLRNQRIFLPVHSSVDLKSLKLKFF